MKIWNYKLIIVAIGMMVLGLLIITFDDYLIHVKGYLFAGILVVAGYIDIKTRTIPDWIHLLIMLVALIKIDLIVSLIGLVVVPLPFFIMAYLKENSFGGGDIKLIGACGFLLGLRVGVVGSMLSLLIAIVASAIYYFIKKKKWNVCFPLGPYLCMGFILVYIYWR